MSVTDLQYSQIKLVRPWTENIFEFVISSNIILYCILVEKQVKETKNTYYNTPTTIEPAVVTFKCTPDAYSGSY